MRVLRVENIAGQGPYWHSGECNISPEHAAMQRKHTGNAILWPGPVADGLPGDIQCGEVYGFINEAQLYNWFSEDDLTMLSANGYNVVEYNGDVTGSGANQVVFMRIQTPQTK